jgi:hypothetical protein
LDHQLPLLPKVFKRCMPFMKLLLTILFSFSLIIVFGQSSEENIYRFPTTVFKSDLYKPTIFKRYEGEIKNVGNAFYQFGNKHLKLSLDDTTILEVFKLGIFNPDIIFGRETFYMDQAELDTLPQNQRVLYNLIRNDSLSICCFELLEKLNPNTQTIRFRFWVFRTGIHNPSEYYLELQNANATKATSLKDFLKNSVMTFFYKGTIII